MNNLPFIERPENCNNHIRILSFDYCKLVKEYLGCFVFYGYCNLYNKDGLCKEYSMIVMKKRMDQR